MTAARWLVALAMLGGTAPALRAQVAPAYGLASVGISFSDRNRHGGALVFGARVRQGTHVSVGAELQFHGLTGAMMQTLEAPCPPDEACGPGRYPGTSLVAAMGVVEAFEGKNQAGFGLLAGIGPTVYTQMRSPSQTPRWGAALAGGVALALPLGPARLRGDARILQIVQPSVRPTRILLFGAGLQM